MRTRIISAFPGVGKTYFHNNCKEYTSLDSDSSNFSWTENTAIKLRNPDFPNNYIEHIKSNIGKYDFIFVSSHAEVRKALKDACLFFYLIYPKRCDKEKYIQRYKDRGSSIEFIELLSNNWDKWIKECEHEQVGCASMYMVFVDLEKQIKHIIYSENGGN